MNLAKARFGLDFWLPFDQAKGRRTSIIAWTIILCRYVQFSMLKMKQLSNMSITAESRTKKHKQTANARSRLRSN